MIAETITLIGLILPLPPTWASDDVSPLIIQLDDRQETPTLNNTEWLPDDTAVSVINQSGSLSSVRMISFGVNSADREVALWMLESELDSYRDAVEREANGDPSWNIEAAVNAAKSLINAIPSTAPLPRPMLLSERVAIYWESESGYAEIDFDGSNLLDAYGKRSGMLDVYLDGFPIASADGQVSFPSQIEGIISSEKAIAPA